MCLIAMARLACRWAKKFLMFFYPSSEAHLVAAEKKVLSYLKTPFKTQYVNIGPVVGEEDCKVWSLSMNEDSENTPIVFLHGIFQGVGTWVLNLDTIAVGRPVYAIDVPGFGRSSRPVYSTNGLQIENQMVDCIEAWRREMKLEKFILLGLSMGGFLATSYALRFPNRLLHLILIDPWGFPKEPNKKIFFAKTDCIDRKVTILADMIVLLRTWKIHITPIYFIHLAGMIRLGKMATYATFSWCEYFSALGENGKDDMLNYMFHCSSQKPRGDITCLSASSPIFGIFWAKFPMIERIHSLDEKVPITFVYGTKSFLAKSHLSEIKKILPNSYVDEQLMEGERHECNISDSETFNKIIIKVCARWDQDAEKLLMFAKNDVQSCKGIASDEKASEDVHHNFNIENFEEQERKM